MPAEHARRLAVFAGLLEAARHARNLAIVDALRAGAGVREVAKAVGLSSSQVQKIGHDMGWPDDLDRAKWAKAHEEFLYGTVEQRAEIARLIEQLVEQPRDR